MKVVALVVILVSLLAMPAFAFPTYTSNTKNYYGGTYGATNIVIPFEDETGNQMFDGDYGGYYWMYRQGIQSVEDYHARYEEQNGYAYAWVAWYNDILTPTILFDMKEQFLFNSIGFHGYERMGVGAVMPDFINVAFSYDGVIFFTDFSQVFPEWIEQDTVHWRTILFQPIQARFVRITFETPSSRNWLDEIAINGMDGAQFAATVPEPSSLLVLATFVTGLSLKVRRIR